MNFGVILYALILLAYGEIMYERGQRDIAVVMKKAKDMVRQLEKEGNEDEKN